MDREKIIMILCAESYPEFMLEQTADKVEKLTPNINEAFEMWADTGNVPQIEIEGFTFTSLREKFNMRPVAVFLALDWLTREPQKAKVALNRGIR
jgi:uridine phosphorylase